MKMQFDAVIAGAGVVGMAAALALAERNLNVALIDAKPLVISAEPDVRVYAVNEASQQLFQQLGIWPSLLASGRVSPYERMFVWDGINQAHIEFDTRLIAAHQLGAIIEENTIKNALLQAIKANQAITCFPECLIEALVPSADNIVLHCSNQILDTNFLCIADGAESLCRRLLNVKINSWPYHQHALVATVNTEYKHGKTAYQVFLKDGPLAFLPLNDPHQCSIVWSTSPTHAKYLLTLDENSFNNELSQAFANKLGKVTLCSQRFQFPLTMRHTRQYSGANWILMGDAAHTIHPLAGLGLNIGLADLAYFIKLLDGNELKISKGLLEKYQRQRKNEVWQNIIIMEALKTIFANPLTPLVALRGMGLNLCNKINPLKRLFIQHARGSN